MLSQERLPTVNEIDEDEEASIVPSDIVQSLQSMYGMKREGNYLAALRYPDPVNSCIRVS